MMPDSTNSRVASRAPAVVSPREVPNANVSPNPRLYVVSMGNFAARVAPETLLAAITGQPWAIELIAEAYWPTAYRLAVAVLGHRGPDAEDAAQERNLIADAGYCAAR